MKNNACETCRFYDAHYENDYRGIPKKMKIGWCIKKKEAALPNETCEDWYSNAVREMVKKHMRRRYRITLSRWQ